MILFKKKTVLAFLLVLQIASCSRPATERLRVIDSVLWEHADSALFLLQDFQSDYPTLSERDNAYWALLYSIALDKNYVFVTSDSLIIQALEYYKQGKDRRKEMLSWYYYGLVHENSKEYSSAIIAFEKAERIASELGDSHYLGLINREKAAVYGSTNNNAEALSHILNAIDFFTEANSANHALFAKLSLATILTNDRKYDEADSLITDLLASSDNPYITSPANLLKAQIYLDEGKDSSVPDQIYKSTPLDYYTLLDYPFHALSEERNGHHASADEWIKRGYDYSLDQADSATVESAHARIENSRKHFNTAYRLLNHAANIQDSLTRVILRQSVSTAQRDYYKQENLLQAEAMKRVRQNTIWGCGFGILAVIMVISALIHRSRKKDQLLKEQMAQLAIHEQDLFSLRKDNAFLVGTLFKEEFNQLNELSKEYYSADDSAKKDIVFKAFKQRLHELRNEDALFESLEANLNRFCNNIIKKLKEQVPNIEGIHLKTISLFFAGVPYHSILLILGAPSIESLKMARSRYRKIIKDSEAEDADLFLNMLEMKKGKPSKGETE